ncbi:MAG: hypothetical protein ACRDEB_02250, partial [Chitinophagaceae bacterium]
QHNWFKMMEFFQNDMLNYYSTNSGIPVFKITFQYTTGNEQNKAALNFHLTRQEEKDIISSLYSVNNQKSFSQVKTLLESRGLPGFKQTNIYRPW